jgi:hypothetical protein
VNGGGEWKRGQRGEKRSGVRRGEEGKDEEVNRVGKVR